MKWGVICSEGCHANAQESVIDSVQVFVDFSFFASIRYVRLTITLETECSFSLNSKMHLLLFTSHSSVARKERPARWSSIPCWTIMASAALSASAAIRTVRGSASLWGDTGRGRTTSTGAEWPVASSCPAVGGLLALWGLFEMASNFMLSAKTKMHS